MPKSRNRQSKAISRQVWKKIREITTVLREYYVTLNQHAQVVNGQRARIAKLELHIQLLEEKVYANLTPEERERLADILDPQPETTQPTEAQTAPEPAVIEGEVITGAAEIEEALRDTVPATTNPEPREFTGLADDTAPESGLTFPNHPVIPTTPVTFVPCTEQEPATEQAEEGVKCCGEYGNCGASCTERQPAA